MKQMKPKKKKKQDAAVTRPSVVIPYVEKVSQTVASVMKKYNVPCAMKPWVTLKNVLVPVSYTHLTLPTILRV